jgi:phage protein D
VTQRDDGTTTLAGVVQNQAQLHGLQAKIRDLGVTLVQLDVVEEPDSG